MWFKWCDVIFFLISSKKQPCIVLNMNFYLNQMFAGFPTIIFIYFIFLKKKWHKPRTECISNNFLSQFTNFIVFTNPPKTSWFTSRSILSILLGSFRGVSFSYKIGISSVNASNSCRNADDATSIQKLISIFELNTIWSDIHCVKFP